MLYIFVAFTENKLTMNAANDKFNVLMNNCIFNNFVNSLPKEV